MNKIFIGMYQNKLFTLSEANKIIKDYQVCRNNIDRLVKQKLIIRLKAGIYYIKPLDNPEFYPDPIHIASKLRPDAVICANSALRVMKLSSATESVYYICAKHPSKLRIDKNTYKIIKNFNFGIEKIEYMTAYGKVDLKITDIERTFLDCIRTRSVKAEELINILRNKPIALSIKKIQTYLEKYDMPILYNKTGMILDVCKQNLKIDDQELDKIRKKLSKKIYYYKERGIKLIRPRYRYYKEWNIMIPEHQYELIKTLKPGIVAQT